MCSIWSALLDIIDEFPIRLVGHSLGGIIVLHYAGIYPAKVSKAVSIEGIGFPPTHRVHGPASNRLRYWLEARRDIEKRKRKPYPTLDAAMARMKEANPHLERRSGAPPYAARHQLGILKAASPGSSITMPAPSAPSATTLPTPQRSTARSPRPRCSSGDWESFAPVPENDPRVSAMQHCRLVKVSKAGHWVHHDQLELFLKETKAFLER